MSVTEALLVALGGAVGAPLRFLVDRAVAARLRAAFPAGTFAVNVTGSLILGVIVGLPAGPALTALLGTGLCGAFTTYSTFAYEVVRLADDDARATSAVYLVATVVAGLLAAATGLALGRALGG